MSGQRHERTRERIGNHTVVRDRVDGAPVSVDHIEIRAGAYADSVTLMQLSQQVGAGEGVESALVAMGTALNLGLLVDMGFAQAEPVSANDLVIAVRARDDAGLRAALAGLDAALNARPQPSGTRPADLQPPRTVGSAARRSGAALALISVPGQHAFTEAMDALDVGCDVMIFSDNVPVEQEIILKQVAAERGLLVLGPDSGTTVVAGVGLGFANSVAPGPVGIVAASGTGAQQVLCLLDAAGVGVSAALGTGGRDMSAAVGGRSTRAALTALGEDPATELIMVVSKTPAQQVAAGVRSAAAELATPVQFALIGPGQPDLTTAVERALNSLGVPAPRWPSWRPALRSSVSSRSPGRRRADDPGTLRGLFAGGTLCAEAMVIASSRLGPIGSNIALKPQWRVDPRSPVTGHVMIDFGDDALTAGRPHPMIDQSLRLQRLAADALDSTTRVIILDVVLGHGAHPDPASELAPAIAAVSNDVIVVVSLIGTAADPQNLTAQATALQAAGAHVFASNAQATRFGCDMIEGAS